MKKGHDPRLSTTFVGRGAETAQLVAAAKAAARRKTTVALELVGPAGSGKSRLVSAALDTLVAAGLPSSAVLHGTCPSEQRQPLAILQSMVRRRLLSGEEGSSVAELVRAVQDALGDCDAAAALARGQRGLESLVAGLPEDASPTIGGLDDVQQGLCALLGAVGAMSAAKGWPAVLFLDDVQWLDEASAIAGRALLNVQLERGLLVILARRPTGGVPSRWRARLGIERLDLAPLSAASTRSMAIALLGVGVARGLAAAVADRAAGDPFACEQVLMVCAVAAEAVPRRVLDAVLARVEGRPMSSAAAVGRLLARGWLDVGRHASRRSEDLLVFRHARLRAAVEQIVPGARKSGLHAACAQVLEAQHRDRIEPWLGAIARHYDAAGDTDAGLRWRLRAGRHAMSLRSIHEAHRDLQRAVDIATTSGEQATLAEALCSLAEVHLAHGDCGEAIDTCARALAATPTDVVRARLLFVQSRAHVEQQQAALAAPLADEAQRWAPADDHDLRARLHLLRARLCRYAMDVDGAFQALDAAASAAALAGSDALGADVLTELAYAAVQRNDDAALRRAYGGLTAVARTAGAGPRGAALSALGLVASAYLGDMPHACRAYDEAARIGRDTGELPRQLDAGIGGLMARCYLGALREGEAMRGDLVRLAERVEVARHSINLDLILATHSLHRGEWKRALKEIRRALARMGKLDVPLAQHDRAIFAYIEGQALHAMGERREGRATVERAVQVWHSADQLKLYRHEADLVLADILLTEGDPEAAAAPLRRADDALQRIPNRYYRAWSSACWARHHRATGQHEAALQAAEQGNHHATAAGSDYQRIRTLLQHALAQHALGHAGAEQTLQEATALADRCGATGLHRECLAGV